MNLAPVGIMITSYEVDGDQLNPTLSHIFWGKSFKDAIGIAKSHLVTDYFFNATMLGEMTWHNDKIYIEYDGQMMGTKKFSHQKMQDAYRMLRARAKAINQQPTHRRMVNLIQKIE
jgi:hypothetical protein